MSRFSCGSYDLNVNLKGSMQNIGMALLIFGIIEMVMGISVFTFFTNYVSGGWWGAILVLICGGFAVSSANRGMVIAGFFLCSVGIIVVIVSFSLDIVSLQLFTSFTGCYSMRDDEVSGAFSNECVPDPDSYDRNTVPNNCICWQGKTTSNCHKFTLASGDCNSIFASYIIYLGSSTAFGCACLLFMIVYFIYLVRELFSDKDGRICGGNKSVVPASQYSTPADDEESDVPRDLRTWVRRDFHQPTVNTTSSTTNSSINNGNHNQHTQPIVPTLSVPYARQTSLSSDLAVANTARTIDLQSYPQAHANSAMATVVTADVSVSGHSSLKNKNSVSIATSAPVERHPLGVVYDENW